MKDLNFIRTNILFVLHYIFNNNVIFFTISPNQFEKYIQYTVLAVAFHTIRYLLKVAKSGMRSPEFQHFWGSELNKMTPGFFNLIYTLLFILCHLPNSKDMDSSKPKVSRSLTCIILNVYFYSLIFANNRQNPLK
jgi:hypothetical protein